MIPNQISIPVRREIITETIVVDVPAYFHIWDDFENGMCELSTWYKVIESRKVIKVEAYSVRNKIMTASIELHDVVTLDADTLRDRKCQAIDFQKAFDNVIEHLSTVRYLGEQALPSSGGL